MVFNLSKQPKPSTSSIVSAGRKPSSVCEAHRCLQDSEDSNKLVSLPAMGSMAPQSLEGLKSHSIAWISLLPFGCGRTGNMVAGDTVPGAEMGGMRVPTTFQLAAREQSGANDFPRLLLRVGSVFPTQR